jgi:hypothetical protein
VFPEEISAPEHEVVTPRGRIAFYRFVRLIGIEKVSEALDLGPRRSPLLLAAERS